MRVITPKGEVCLRKCKLTNCYGKLECSRTMEFTCCKSFSELHENEKVPSNVLIEAKVYDKEVVGDHSDEYYLRLEREASYVHNVIRKPRVKKEDIPEEILEEDIPGLVSKITYLNKRDLKSRFKDKKNKSKPKVRDRSKSKIRKIRERKVVNG
jgi:hypothetical protein